VSLTEHQRRFVEAYAATGSGVEAARAAGYKGRWLKTTATRLLKAPDVVAALEEHTRERAAANVASRQERLERLTTILRDTGAEFRDRIKAAELMARMCGDLVEKVEHTAAAGLAVVVRFPVNSLGDGQAS
jgi:phage terminase small subunit